MKKVSIIIPIYNVEKYIKRCAISLFKQSYSNIEFVFVDDATPDSSMDILAEVIRMYAEPRVKIIKHENNQGLSAARKTGLDHSTGDLVMFVDSDDYLDIKAVEILVKAQEIKNYDIVESNFCFIDNKGNKKKALRIHENSKIDYLCDLIKLKTYVSLWAKLYKRDLIEHINVLFVPGKDTCEDYFATVRLIANSKDIKYVDESLYFYDISNLNSYSNTCSSQKILDLEFAIKKNEQYLKDLNLYNSDIAKAFLYAKLFAKSAYYINLNSEGRILARKVFPELLLHINEFSIYNRLQIRCIMFGNLSLYIFLVKLHSLKMKIWNLKK